MCVDNYLAGISEYADKNMHIAMNGYFIIDYLEVIPYYDSHVICGLVDVVRCVVHKQ